MKVVLFTLLFATITASANSRGNGAYGSWQANGTISTINIDSDRALQEGVEDSALQIGFYADYLQNSWVSTIGASFIIYQDDREFEQTVIGKGLYNDGDIYIESSDANAMLIHLATGYRWTFGEAQKLDFITQGGFSFSALSERSIDYCSNCYSEDIELDGGAFIKARLSHSSESVRFGLMVQQFISGDFDTVIGFEIGSSF